MNVTRERICYNALASVYKDGAYSSHALDAALAVSETDEREFITRLFYGVLERDVTLCYIVDKLVAKRPKLSVTIILKMGIYMLRYMRVADYAAVDGCVELAKSLGKSGVSGFVNAVLRKAPQVVLPQRGEVDDVSYLSVTYGLPKWLAEKFSIQYGFDFVEKMMKTEEYRTHIRLRSGTDVIDFEKKLSKYVKVEESKTKYGYYVTHNILNSLIKFDNLKQTDFAVQSLASSIAVNCYAEGLSEESKVLDLCAAPGGKAVYLAELTHADITACDIHEHRVGLIKSYINRMGVRVKTVLNDACVKRSEWAGAYDCVICDIPCSGTGDLRSKPDILLRRNSEAVTELSGLQKRILRQAAEYVRTGGKLCYSTCSILKAENEDIVENFLKHNSEFSLADCLYRGEPNGNALSEIAEDEKDTVSDRCLHLFPHTHGTDGFFVAIFKKNLLNESALAGEVK